MRKMISAAAGLLLAAPVLTAISPAQAAQTAQTAPTTQAANSCYVQSGGVTPGNDSVDRYVISTSPITARPADVMAKNPFGSLPISLSTQWTWDDDFGDEMSLNGHLVSGDVMYAANQWVQKGTGGQVVRSSLTRIGGGWSAFRTLTQSWSLETTGWRVYALRGDGSLFRWNLTSQNNGTELWKAAGSYPGFSAVKAVTLLSRTPTYDSLLATTWGGALYSIRIPLTSPMKPIVTPLRTRTWGSFERLLTARCGNYGTLLLGIDKDTSVGYLYAVGHANGTATVINSLGKVPATFDNRIDFSWGSVVDNPLNGD